MHQLELLHGLGKKHMKEIIDAREDKLFDSFADMKARVKVMPRPEEAIVKRILLELDGLEKHNLFVK
jgi:putative nucleotide binding protein